MCLARVTSYTQGYAGDPDMVIPYGPAIATRFCAVIQPGVILPP